MTNLLLSERNGRKVEKEKRCKSGGGVTPTITATTTYHHIITTITTTITAITNTSKIPVKNTVSRNLFKSLCFNFNNTIRIPFICGIMLLSATVKIVKFILIK